MTNQTYDEQELQRSLQQSVQKLRQEEKNASLFQEYGADNKTADSEPENKIEQLETQLESTKKELLAVKQRLQALESNRDEYKNKYFQFKGIFQRQTHTFYLYQSLSTQSRNALHGVFKGNSFESFLACGVQPDNIDTVWEFSRSLALEGNLEDLEILQTIIVYFVKMYNKTHDSPVLAFQETAPGDRFDVDLHIRTQDSKAAGIITKVLLTGLTNAFSGDIIKKSVVEIKS
ncbi:MAG: hypothetical protein LUH14_00945 [Clostridiaceae bacterium]|nr:hypothetical protein [Clostridiaceae bacterium]